MAQHYRADRNVTNNGARGNGCSWEYDKKTGKYGVRYGDGEFYPDPDEKQPGYQASEPKSEPTQSSQGCGGPSEYDKMVDGLEKEVGKAAGEVVSGTANTIKTILLGIVTFAALKTFISEMKNNPDDMENAVSKTARTAICTLGVIAAVIVWHVFIFIFCASVGSWPETVSGAVFLLVSLACGCTVIGLIRVARGKPFWIDFVGAFRKMRTVKLPKIAYFGIELLTTALLTKPILMWVNSFTVEWTQANQESISNGTVIALGAGMLAGSILIAAAAGLIVCKIVRAFTGGK